MVTFKPEYKSKQWASVWSQEILFRASQTDPEAIDSNLVPRYIIVEKNHNLGGLIGAQARLRIGVRIPSCIGVAAAIEWQIIA